MVEPSEERQQYDTRLDYFRGVVLGKADELTWEQATRQLGPSLTSVAGLVKHLTRVEQWWFEWILAGGAYKPPGRETSSRDSDFMFDAGDSLDSLIEAYQAACVQSREIVARYDLDDLSARDVWFMDGKPVTVRWIYGHVITETARHCGHLDIYRELIDGRVGLQ